MRRAMLPSIALATMIAAWGEGVEGRDGTRLDRQPTKSGAAGYGFTPDPRRQYPSVVDRGAPTIADLKARGLEQTGWDAIRYACGPACDAVYPYAVFFGRRARHPATNAHLFTCPNPGRPGPQETWRCAPFAGRISGR